VGGELGRGTVELDRVRTIRTLQRAAMGQFEKNRDRNAMGFRDRLLPLQHGEAVVGLSHPMVREVAHVVFSRASVKKPLSARSCSIAITSVTMASRGAAYFCAS